MTIIFTDTKSHREDILTHPELHFDQPQIDGPLYGMRIVGLTLVKGEDGRLVVIYPTVFIRGSRYPIFKRIHPDVRSRLTRTILDAWAARAATPPAAPPRSAPPTSPAPHTAPAPPD